MNAFEVNKELRAVLPITEHEYRGPENKKGQRNGKGKEEWRREERDRYYERYTGSFIQDSLHGTGVYNWFADNLKFVYEGQFYTSNLEGYGLMSYPNGNFYEGLFKNNERYGPGIYTYTDGSKDIGLWSENRLVRLCLTDNTVPLITNTARGKSHILHFRHLMPIEKPEDIPEELCNNHIRNQKSYFFNVKIHDESFFLGDSKVDQNLIAWNNSETCMNLMYHCFLHRNSENHLSYNIVTILNGECKQFSSSFGMLERACIILLKCSAAGDTETVKELIRSLDLNPDVTDSLGNTAVMYAACNDHTRTIIALRYFGANFDYVNDECLTPLNMCLLRLIACKEDVTDWERAFLPVIDDYNVPKTPVLQKYLFNLNCVSLRQRAGFWDPEGAKAMLMNKIKKTTSTLLNYGADPNCGEVPYPPLVVSLFTDEPNLTSQLLNYKADVRVTAGENNLTPLHIIASMAPSANLARFADVLLENGADIAARCGTLHWPEEKNLILAEVETEDFGKTPLHLLSVRCDFLIDENRYLDSLLEVFLRHQADMYSQYLGHTALTLAMLKNNQRFMHVLLEFGVNPNHFLGNEMGVPLAVPALRRYNKHFARDAIKQIYTILQLHKANPFFPVPDFEGNAIEYVLHDNKSSAQMKQKLNPTPFENLKNVAKNVLLRQIQGNAIRSLYKYKIRCGLDDPIFVAMSHFVTVSEAIEVLRILIREDQLPDVTERRCVQLLKFVDEKSPRKSNQSIDILSKSHLKFQEITHYKSIIPDPEADLTKEHYNVCFECYQKLDKELVMCPGCHLVYFCSDHCNTMSLRKRTGHSCRGIFYSTERLFPSPNKLKIFETVCADARADSLESTVDRLSRMSSFRYTFDMLSLKASESRSLESKKRSILSTKPSSRDKLRRKTTFKEDDDDSHHRPGLKTKRKVSVRFSLTSAQSLKSSMSDDEKGKKGKRGVSASGKYDEKGKKGKRGMGSPDFSDKKGKKGKRGMGSPDFSDKKGKKGKRGMSSPDFSDEKGKKGGKKGKKSGDSSSDSGKLIDLFTKSKRKTKMDTKSQRSRSSSKSSSRSTSTSRSSSGARSKRTRDKKGVKDKKDKKKDMRKGAKRKKDEDRKRKPRALLKRKDKGLFAEDTSHLRKKLYSNVGEKISDECKNLLDSISYFLDAMKFNQMFLPYCLLINGQLYYKFDRTDNFYKLTYSDI